MISITVPNIFFQEWFWFALLLAILSLVYVVKKKGPTISLKPDMFFVKHRKLIRKLGDILIICILLFSVILLMCVAIPLAVKSILTAPPEPESRAVYLQATWALFLMAAICLSGFSGMLVGLLSVFQSNLTKLKRVILLIVCLWPIVLTVLAVVNELARGYGLIKLGLVSSFACWIVNGPAVLIGRPFFQILEAFIKKLYRVFSIAPGSRRK